MSARGRALVTGGAGFIGSHLVDRLVADGRAVTVLDDFSTGRLENLEAARSRGDVRIVEGSILSAADVTAALEGAGDVFHLAVECVRRSLGDPLHNHEVNATGTLNLLEAARRAGVRRFVYCSSSEVYGNAGSGRLDEERTVPQPTTVYGAAKLAGEHYTLAYHRTYGLKSVVLRPFNAYGPREHDRGDLAEVIPRFVIRVLNDRPPVIFGSGASARDFTYVTETARGIARAAEVEQAVGRVINLARGACVSVAELAELVCRLCQRPHLRPIHLPPRPGDILRLHADTRRAEELLGYRAEIDIEQGLEMYLHWFTHHYPDPSALLEEEPVNWRMPDDGTRG